MKLVFVFAFILFQFSLLSCHSSKLISKVIAPKDSVIVDPGTAYKDSMLLIQTTMANLKNNHIDFTSFSAKIKVDIEDAKGKQPDITATLRMIKDSAIWISLTATFLGVEVYRVHITPDSVILMNKQAKEVQYRSLDYLQDVTQIPFDFKTIQDMFIGNPVFFNESNVIFKRREDLVLASSIGEQFKNLLTLASGNNLLVHSKLDDVDVYRNRTASVSYDDYELIEGKHFSTRRQITISEKNKLDIRLNFKQVEFNKELSVAFSVPKNYKKK
jgi:hypothetical protein